MPIVVNYDTMDALGGAALQAGYQTGRASGQEDFLRRQQADTHMLLGNAFDRQRETRQRGYQVQDQNFAANQHAQDQGFAANQADIGRQFEAQQNELQRQKQLEALYGQAAIHSAQDERNFQQTQDLYKLQDNLTGQRQSANLSQAENFQAQQAELRAGAKDREFTDSYRTAYPGASDSEVLQALAQNRLDQQSHTGAFARLGARGATSGKPDLGPFGTRSGTHGQNAYDATRLRGVEGALESLNVARNLSDPRLTAGAIQEVKNGIGLAISEAGVSNDNLSAMIPNIQDPDLRHIVQMELDRRGGMRGGSNQEQPQGVSGGFTPASADPRYQRLSPAQQRQLNQLDAEIMGRH